MTRVSICKLTLGLMLLLFAADVRGGTANAYDPQSASEATGYTIRQLDEHQLLIVGHAAQFVTMVKWCGYSYFAEVDPLTILVGKFGVHRFDFKNYVAKLRKPTLQRLRETNDWQRFCGKGIYDLFGTDGELFGSKGRYPNLEPWLRRIVIKPGMTKKRVEAEVELTVAYYGAARCIDGFYEFDYAKEEAYKTKHGLDDDWQTLIADQSIEFQNEAFLRLGPESLMDCSAFRKKHRQLLPPS